MKVILFMSMSLNGIIADKNGKENFLSHTNWECFNNLAKRHGCFVVGRKAYEAVQKWPEYNFSSISAKLKIVISSKNKLKLNPPFTLASSPRDALKKATGMNFKNIILTGGSNINSAFMTENLVDEILINIEPTVVGTGLPLFSGNDFEKRLSFISATKISNGILQVRYKVNKK